MSSSEGPGLIRLRSSTLEVEIDPGLGAEVRWVSRPGGPNVLAAYEWGAPLSIRRSSPYGDPELDWLSDYRGGWQELFPNAGDASIVDGVPLPFHGEASRARWDVLEVGPDRASLRTAARLPLVLERSMWVTDDPPALRIDEVVRCDAPLATPFLLGHHPAFVATEGARIDLPADARLRVDEGYVTDLVDLAQGAEGAWPTIAARHGGTVDLGVIGGGPVQRLLYASELGPAPWAAMRGVHPGMGVALAWDAGTFPHVWMWWEIGGNDFPWYGRARILAIEPNTAIPSDGLAAARARGEAHEVTPGSEHRSWLTLSLFDADERPVRGVDRTGDVTR